MYYGCPFDQERTVVKDINCGATQIETNIERPETNAPYKRYKQAWSRKHVVD